MSSQNQEQAYGLASKWCFRLVRVILLPLYVAALLGASIYCWPAHRHELGGSWLDFVAVMAIYWLAIHLACVTLRGAVLYVMTGRFLPARGVRSWLVPW
jgi:hypothetical protein